MDDKIHTGAGDFSARSATEADHDALYTAFRGVVERGEGYPHAPPLERTDFAAYWLAGKSAVVVLRAADGQLAGSYYLKPNFPGRAAHICNAGYFVVPQFRGQGVGRAAVEHSLVAARQLGFDAMQYNLVFVSNPARKMYESLGFREIGRIPDAVEGEAALVYWRPL